MRYVVLGLLGIIGAAAGTIFLLFRGEGADVLRPTYQAPSSGAGGGGASGSGGSQ